MRFEGTGIWQNTACHEVLTKAGFKYSFRKGYYILSPLSKWKE